MLNWNCLEDAKRKTFCGGSTDISGTTQLQKSKFLKNFHLNAHITSSLTLGENGLMQILVIIFI